MKTTDQILHAIHLHRPGSRAWLYQQFTALGIKPAGINQRPQMYPDDTASRILTACGYVLPGAEGPPRPPLTC